MLTRILSGGQTGVDRAALDAALALGIPCGGACPAGRWAEDGAIPARYPLVATPGRDPAERTRANVAAADGTLIVVSDTRSASWGPGTRLTHAAAAALGKTCLVVAPEAAAAGVFRRWLAENRIATLNVAGPRESEQPGIYVRARAWLESAFRVALRPPA